MVARRWLLILLLVLLHNVLLHNACSARSESESAPQRATLTASEYITQLDALASSVQQLAQPDDARKLLQDIPPVWHIQAEHIQAKAGIFDVSSEWLRDDLNNWRRKPSREILDRIACHLQTLRSEAASFQQPPSDESRKRVLLNGILASREFQDLHGPTWLDRLNQRILEALIRMLGRIFRSSAVPTIGNVVVYGFMALAVLAVAYWMYRTIRNNAGMDEIVPHILPVSSKGWKLWMNEARLAAEQGNWRDAIHLAYWCGISFLEAQELWRPDVARTPREYLRLLPAASEQRPTLGALTRTFELVWYGKHEGDARAFSETLAQLEKLGCQSN
jgi:Domain of unknown function (DUF4129)